MAGLNIATTITNLFNIIYIQLGACISIVVGQYLGAGELKKAKDADNKMIVFSVFCCAAVNAGFDLVEIHAGHSYLISQFLSPLMNDRTDEFGGSAENRTRFCRMVIDEVRKAVGPKVPISLRLSVDELVAGGNTMEDCLEYLEYLNDEVDLFDTSAALNQSIQYQIDANYLKDGWRSYMAKAVRDKFQKPTIAMGNIRDPKVADDIIARGDADFIGMGRGLIADPNWCNKAQ